MHNTKSIKLKKYSENFFFGLKLKILARFARFSAAINQHVTSIRGVPMESASTTIRLVPVVSSNLYILFKHQIELQKLPVENPCLLCLKYHAYFCEWEYFL
jgi:hypothetical protein